MQTHPLLSALTISFIWPLHVSRASPLNLKVKTVGDVPPSLYSKLNQYFLKAFFPLVHWCFKRLTLHLTLCRWIVAHQFDRQEPGGLLCALPAPGVPARCPVCHGWDWSQGPSAKPWFSQPSGQRVNLLPQDRPSLLCQGLQDDREQAGLLSIIKWPWWSMVYWLCLVILAVSLQGSNDLVSCGGRRLQAALSRKNLMLADHQTLENMKRCALARSYMPSYVKSRDGLIFYQTFHRNSCTGEGKTEIETFCNWTRR